MMLLGSLQDKFPEHATSCMKPAHLRWGSSDLSPNHSLLPSQALSLYLGFFSAYLFYDLSCAGRDTLFCWSIGLLFPLEAQQQLGCSKHLREVSQGHMPCPCDSCLQLLCASRECGTLLSNAQHSG